MTKRRSDPFADLAADLAAIYRRYIHLTGLLPRGRSGTTQHIALGSSEPLNAAYLDHLAALDRYIDWWLHAAARLLQPEPVWEIALPCPHCGAALTGYPGRNLIVCDGTDSDDPHTWQGQGQWWQLGQMLADQGAILVGRDDMIRKRRRPRPPIAKLAASLQVGPS